MRCLNALKVLPLLQNDCLIYQIFGSQNDCPVYLPGKKFEAQSQIFLHQIFIIKKSLDTTPLGVVLE